VIVYSAKRHGVKLVCFDNLQLLCRSVENTFQEQAHVSRGFKELAMDLDIAILLVVQPRKMDPRSSPGMYDPSGSGSIIADADGMLSLWRKPSHSSDETITEEDIVTEERESFSPEVLIRCPASRYRAGGQAVLYFDGDRATFTEMDESHALAPVRIRSEESS
jgi:replicative DNA helicase